MEYKRVLSSIKECYERTPRNDKLDFTKELEGLLRELICRNVREDIPADPVCPCCSCSDHVRYGHTDSGNQRYRCRGCGRVFTPYSRRNLLSNSKLPLETWPTCCMGFVNRYPLRKCARMCDVSLYASFFMRRHILEIVSGCHPPFRAEAGTQIQLDEIYLRESFKGPDRGNRIPRRSRKRAAGRGRD